MPCSSVLFALCAGYWSGAVYLSNRRVKLLSCLSELYVRLEHVGSVSLPALCLYWLLAFQLRWPVLNYLRHLVRYNGAFGRVMLPSASACAFTTTLRALTLWFSRLIVSETLNNQCS